MLLLALLGAGPADLAPGPAELRHAEEALVELLALADAQARATFRLQEAWTAGTRPQDACRLRTFAEAWGRSAQSVRVRGQALERIAAAPTVVPLLDDADSARLEALSRRAADHEAAWLELVAWDSRSKLPRCETPLAAAPGFPHPGVQAADDPVARVAIVATGGGWLCPEGVPADGRVVVLRGTTACVAPEATCGCTPQPALPGAVLAQPR